MMSLEKVQNLKPFSLFVFFFALALERIFTKTHHTERRCYRTGKYTVFEVRPCIFQPGNFTGWGSEGVKTHCILGGFFLDFTWMLADLYGLVKQNENIR